MRYLLSYLDVEELLADAIRTDGGGPEGGADLATRAGTRHSTRYLAAGGGGTRPAVSGTGVAETGTARGYGPRCG